MPNTLAHFGVQGVASRLVFRDADPKWIYAGCIVPDAPWIVRRAVIGLVPGVDPIDVTVYAAVQASFGISLALCAGLAFLSRRPRLIAPLLAFNVLLHLLVDALQTKWGNGVLLFAPFSWEVWNAGLFWPEEWPTYALTIFGAAWVAWAWVRRAGRPVALARPRPGRLLAAVAALALYALLPLAHMDDVEQAESNSLGELRRPEAGDAVAFDRLSYEKRDDGDYIETWADKDFRVVGGERLDHSAQVSFKGRLRAEDSIVLHALHDHGPLSRNYFSYLGLALFALAWVRHR